MVGLLSMDEVWRRNQKTGPITMSELAGAGIGPQPMPMMPPAAQPAAQPAAAPARRGFLSGFFGPEGRDQRQRLALALEGMSLNPNQALIGMIQSDMEGRKQSEAMNRTAEWLKSLGTPQAMQAAEYLAATGDAGNAVKMALEKPEAAERTALQQNVEFLMAQGYNLQDALKAVQGASGGTNINMGEPLKIMQDGRIAIADPSVEGGVRFVTPPGSAAATTAANTAKANEQKVRNDQAYSDSLLDNIDALIGKEDGSEPGMITDGKGWTSLSNVGTAASKTIGWLQGPTNIDETIKSIKGQIVLERLQAMKDASATGASGMGTLTDRDVDLLASSIRALSTNLDAPTLRKNLAEIRRIWRQLNQDPQARALYYGQGTAAPAAGGDGFSVTGQIGG